MCKLNKKSGLKRIDPCLELPLVYLNWAIDKKKLKIISSCCGHGKYPKTIVVKKVSDKENKFVFDLLTGVQIPRKKRFYKKDKQGYYYIPEVVKK